MVPATNDATQLLPNETLGGNGGAGMPNAMKLRRPIQRSPKSHWSTVGADLPIG